MSAEKKLPKRRFKQFLNTPSWEQRKLGDVTSNIGDGLHGTPKYDDSGEYYFINGNNLNGYKVIIDNETKKVPEDQLSNDDRKLNENSILMSINGTIGTLARYNGEKIMLGKSVSYINPSDIDRNYLYYYLQNDNVLKTFYKNLTGTTIKNLGLSVIKETCVMKTTIDEEFKIGRFFENFDNLITLHQRKLNKLENLKKAYLEELFPDGNQCKPKRRFKEFKDAWEQRKFSELYEKVTEKNDLSFKLDKVISVASMYYKSDAKVSSEEYLKTYNIFRYGEIAFEGNKSKEYSYGRFVENTIGDGIVSHVFEVFKPIAEYDIKYWKYFINYEPIMGKILSRCTKKTTMMTNLVEADFLKEEILVPKVEEQAKIGEFISKFDNLITLHQHK